MRIILSTAAIMGLLIPISALGQFSCPELMSPELDWDGDGVRNEDDACCFVTSKKGDESAKVCGEERSEDMNGNGVSAGEEGMCCVAVDNQNTTVATPSRAYCYGALSNAGQENDTETGSGGVSGTDGDGTAGDDGEKEEEEEVDTSSGESHNGDTAMSGTDSGWTWADDSEYACANDAEVMVPCDQLLMYDGMPLDGALSDAVVDCGENDCICYTIGDYDDDDSYSEGGIDGPFDNCPLTCNSGSEFEDGMQSDVDGDLFGDACDVCQGPVDVFLDELASLSNEAFELKFAALQCEIGGSDCPGGHCVPRAFRNPYYLAGAVDAAVTSTPILVGNFCSSPSDMDKDGVGDSCDNCIDVSNVDQVDQDADMAGDLCDACPLDAAIWEPGAGMLNTDGDQVVDSCDNCPAVDNPDQADDDSDGVGNACDLCPRDATVFSGVDMDSDGHADICDNCASVANPEQLDTDSNGIGDMCEKDTSSSTATDVDTATATATVRDTQTSRANTDTGAVSFSGGGVISCQMGAPQKDASSRSASFFTILTVIFDL